MASTPSSSPMFSTTIAPSPTLLARVETPDENFFSNATTEASSPMTRTTTSSLTRRPVGELH
ncbi:hypothetical protein GYH30_014198 [Glycine max]|nr:hypothetical protein GYH30_014198 [Glycine max]